MSTRFPRTRHRRAPGATPYRPERVVPPFHELDPGIRELVRLLWIAGFNPTDSGDGVSKPADERAMGDRPHVFMVLTDPEDLVAESHRLHDFVVYQLGFWLDPAETYCGSDIQPEVPVVTVEASYDPGTGCAVLALMGIDDAMLRGRANLLGITEKREGIAHAEFRALLDLYMAGDGLPLGPGAHEAVCDFIERESKARGFDGWVDAYHRFR